MTIDHDGVVINIEIHSESSFFMLIYPYGNLTTVNHLNQQVLYIWLSLFACMGSKCLVKMHFPSANHLIKQQGPTSYHSCTS